MYHIHMNTAHTHSSMELNVSVWGVACVHVWDSNMEKPYFLMDMQIPLKTQHFGQQLTVSLEDRK